MRVWQVAASVRVALMVLLSGSLVSVLALSGAAQENRGDDSIGERVGEVDEWASGQVDEPEPPIHPSTHLPIHPSTSTPTPHPATTVSDWVAQIEASLVQITGVRIETTEAGLQLVLETAEGRELATPATQTVGNALIADIPNAVLALPEGGAFEQFGPAEGIALVAVTNEPGDTVRVAITGTDAPPVAAVTATGLAVTLGEAVVGAEDDAIQVVVTGEQDGYRVPSTSTVTRTETPLRDIPQSVQIIPQQVLQDQRADVATALRNAPSVRNAAPAGFDSPRILVRGFFSSPAVDGLVSRVFNGAGANFGPDLTGIEQIEVLQGPNAVLFGTLSPGGTVNYVTKRPLDEPYYFAEATLGNFSFYRGEVDLSGPLDAGGQLLYRLNASYRDQGSFLDFNRTRNLVIAPVISVALGENTAFNLEAVYKNLALDSTPMGVPAVGSILPNPNGQIPRSLNVNEGSTDLSQIRITANLDHQFDENLSINSTFRYDATNLGGFNIIPGALAADGRTLSRFFADAGSQYRDYRLVTNAIGRFFTGSVEHELLVGLDLGKNSYLETNSGDRSVPDIDIFNPVFGQPLGAFIPLDRSRIDTEELGILVQDRIIFADNLKLLLSGRFDTFTQTGDFGDPSLNQSGNAFSPRVGIVYQPIQPVSLYANYSQSFEPTIGETFSGTPFQPSEGTQYEVGVKTDVNDRLSATLAFYNITRTNALTDDPVNPGFSVQTGEQRSQGIELNLAGEILPGWNVFAGYAYNDSRITRSNIASQVGNRFQRTGPHAASAWTTYEIQQGDLQGLGFGLGLFYVSDRAGDNANTFELPSYVTTDLALFYRRENLRAAINVKNLFDTSYIEGSFNRNRVFYGEPFTIQGTVSWTF